MALFSKFLGCFSDSVQIASEGDDVRNAEHKVEGSKSSTNKKSKSNGAPIPIT
ncbi:hypothetical protein LguiA_005191 [Lonicera macranthoides]